MNLMLHRNNHLISAAFVLLALIVLLVVLEATGFDLWAQNALYDFDAKKWLVDRDNAVGDWLFYTGPKSIIIAIGTLAGLTAFGSLVSARLTPYRRQLWLTVIAMAIITAGVSFVKAETHIHCPRDLQQYGGQAIYNPITEKISGNFAGQPPNVKNGRCFPAGHASGGFALMAFALMLTPSRRKWAYTTGISVGWMMGLYQTLNGAHFLSHTVTTMCWAIFVTQIMLYVAALLKSCEEKSI